MNQAHEVFVPTDDDRSVLFGPREYFDIRGPTEIDVPNVKGIHALIAEPTDQRDRQLLIDDDLHAAMTTAWSTSRAA